MYGNKALKAAREQSGKTQADVARETALNVRMYQRYETGTGNNTIRAAIRIARSLGSTVEELWGNSSSTPSDRRLVGTTE